MAAGRIRAQTLRVIEHHYDTERPGKPLQWVVPGGTVAIGALVAAAHFALQCWYVHAIPVPTAKLAFAVLAPIYVMGVFAFSYGYRLYDLHRALWLTGLIVFATVAVILIVVVLALVLKDAKSSSSRSSSAVDAADGLFRLGQAGIAHATAPPLAPVTVRSDLANPTAICAQCGTSFLAEVEICPNCATPLRA